MPWTRDRVVRQLADANPDYDQVAKRLGPSALPHLLGLVLSPKETALIASKAVEAASRIQGHRSAVRGADVVRAALIHPAPQVRGAAAAATVNLAPFSLEGAKLESRTEDLAAAHAPTAVAAAKDITDAHTCVHVLNTLLSDPHPAVRKCALYAAETTRPHALINRIRSLVESTSSDERIGEQARKTLEAIENNP